MAPLRSVVMAAPLLAAMPGTAAPAQDDPQAPTVITPPASSYSLPPATPTPEPVVPPSPAPVAPPPVVRTAPAPAPTSAATPARRSPPSRRATPPPALEPVAPRAAVMPVLTPTPTPMSVPGPAEDRGGGDWWPLAAVLAAMLAGVAIAAWRRAMRGRDRPGQGAAPVPATPPRQPSPPAAPLAPSAAPHAQAPAVPQTAPPAPATHGIAVDIRPFGMAVDGARALLDFELAVTNVGGSVADGIRALVGMTTAGPDLDAHLAAFAANASLAVATDAFTLAPGEARRIATRLELGREAMHIASAGGRTMIVPVLMVGLRWRGGLSIRALAETHMIGTGDGTARLGPVWFEGQPRRYDRLAARRFTPSRTS